MLSRWMLVPATLLAGSCGPGEPAATRRPATDTTSSSDASASSTGMGASESPHSTDGATTSVTESSTGEADDCSAADPVQGCPAGCMDATAYMGTGDDLDYASGQRSCIPRGETIDATYRSTWWRADGQQRRFLLAGYGCGAHVHAVPLGDWMECGTADPENEPPECAVLCVQDICSGEVDWATLDACKATSPCPPAVWNYGCDATDSDLVCIHQALANHTPGRYDIEFAGPNSSYSWMFIVFADGSAQVASRRSETSSCYTAFNGIWRPAQSCELAEAQFFTMCAESPSWCGGGLDMCQSDSLEGWLLGCVATDPACP